VTTTVTVYVDADACPVKEEVLKVAARHDAPVVMVSNGGLRPSRDPAVRHVVVGAGADAADDWIVEHAAAGDVVVTADVPLASRAVGIGATAISPAGRLFTPESIGMAVAMRNLRQHLRETGEDRGFNAAFSAKARSQFLQALESALRRAKGAS
jgi:uncharacterized protein